MSDKQHIENLINKLLENTISEGEFNDLLVYIDRSESESDIKVVMDEHWEDLKENLSIEQNRGSSIRYKKIINAIGENESHHAEKEAKYHFLRRRGVRFVGVAATFLLIISALIYWMYNIETVENAVVQIEEEIPQHFTGKQFVRLPDGSTVILNEGSELEFSASFGQDTREVTFTGEGYFDIAHDTSKPFIVHTGEVNTTVLGTAFNVAAYGDSDVVVTVERGKVAVGDNEREYEKILPNQQLVVDTQTKKYQKTEVDLSRALAWKNGFLILDGMTIEKAVNVIGQRFGVNVSLTNERIKNCEINAAFMKGESLDQVLSVVCGVLQAEYTLEGESAVIKGGRTCE